MQYVANFYANGRPASAGHNCQPLSVGGGGAWTLPNYYCPSGATPSLGMCPDAVPQLNATSDPTKNFPPDSPTCPSPDQGNPINAATGLKHQTEEDYRRGDGVLYFSRTYTSVGVGGDSPLAGAFGAPGWHSVWHRAIEGDASTARVIRGRGQTHTFTLIAGQWMAGQDVTGKLARLVDGSGHHAGWTYESPENELERYDVGGKLMSTTHVAGQAVSLTYSNGTTSAPDGGYVLSASGAPTSTVLPAGLLIRVTDSNQRSLSFGYDEQHRIVKMVDPANGVFLYSYSAAGNLISVAYPDGKSKIYHYENTTYPHALTGVTDEKSVRFATWTYDSQGRAYVSEHAGGVDQVSLTFNSNGSASVTDASGSVRTQSFQEHQGVARTIGFAQPGGSGCAAATSSLTYDVNGNKQVEDDFNGKRVCYAHDLIRNLQTVRVEGLANTDACAPLVASATVAIPAGARKISTTWHPDWRLAVQVAEPGRLVAYIYNGQPDPFSGGALASCAPASATLPGGKPLAVLCKRVEQATTDTDGHQGLAAPQQSGVPTHVRSWTYNSLGQVLTETSERGYVTAYAYYTATAGDYAIGDLQTVSNALGNVITFSKYNARGQVMKSTDAKGVVTEVAYTPRGWVSAVVSTPPGGVSRTTTYSYDNVGQLTGVVNPDGSTLSYAYDAAQRLVGVSDERGNTISYTLDNMGNRVGEQIKDPGNVLQRSISRSFDALNRLQQVTGAAQ